MEFMFPRAGLSQKRLYARALRDQIARRGQCLCLLAAAVGRNRESVRTLQRLIDVSVRTVFGDVDARKLQASLTLFSEASYDEFLFETMFDVWFNGLLDEDTMTRIRFIAGCLAPSKRQKASRPSAFSTVWPSWTFRRAACGRMPAKGDQGKPFAF
ncbi:hypothetical protein MES5069_200057 [Mesorhizobium escarrei]|uniref:Uncharacterized protein n=2 Tax=Mesorhizobium escarrei TaxID=666018 RepID=A0ABM9DPF7_9HYPH|nr:DUF1810 family protein [Mesorhizobium escarrei]CAH2398535.1 hypothetical protein MES5069_200057 [Mesorhizobium escarrei]